MPLFGQREYTRADVVSELQKAGYWVQVGEAPEKHILNIERMSKTKEGHGIFGIRWNRKDECRIDYISVTSLVEKKGGKYLMKIFSTFTEIAPQEMESLKKDMNRTYTKTDIECQTSEKAPFGVWRNKGKITPPEDVQKLPVEYVTIKK